MQLLATFRILVVPRFGIDEMQTRIYDSLVGQRGFWSYLTAKVVQELGATAEYRLVSHGLNTQITAAVRIHGEPTELMYSALWQLEHMLPADYVWDGRAGPSESFEGRLRMARVVRRINFLDLPSLLPGMQGGESGTSQGEQTWLTRPASEDVRTLPSLSSVPREALVTQFCLALPASLDPYTTRQRVLFEGMQRAGDAVVSICIHPLQERFLGKARIVAQHWHHFLEPFIGELSSAKEAEASSLREAFSKFNLSESQLLYVTLRVATHSDEKTVQLANIVAANAGGARAFQVHAPTRDSDVLNLVRSDLDIPSPSWDEGHFHAVQAELVELLCANKVQNRLEGEDSDLLDLLLQLPHVYTVEMAERLLSLPIADDEGLPGLSSRLQPPFTIPNMQFKPVVSSAGLVGHGDEDSIRLGMVWPGGAAPVMNSMQTTDPVRFKGAFWHGLDPASLTKHALVVGSTGSGKTMTTLFLVREIARLRKPFLVIEPVKTEYYDRLKHKVKNLFRLRLERTAAGPYPNDFLGFDPFRLPNAITVVKHASYLKSCFEAAFPLDAVSSMMLETGLLRYYTSAKEKGGCGLRNFQRGGSPEVRNGRVFPSFATFQDYFLKQYLPSEFAGETPHSSRLAQDYVGLFRRRFQNLDEGLVGECFRAADERVLSPEKRSTLKEYLKSNTVIELDAVPDAEHKALLMAFLLTFVFETRQSEDLLARERGETLPAELRHLLIIEEAHRVLSTSAQQGSRGGELAGMDSRAKAVSLFVDMLAEIRAFGQGIMIVEQIPTKIINEAIKNTNLKIMLRLTSRDDREYLGEAMNFTEVQKRFVTNLKPTKDGISFVIFEEGVEQPLLLTLPFETMATPESKPTANWLYDPFFRSEEISNG